MNFENRKQASIFLLLVLFPTLVSFLLGSKREIGPVAISLLVVILSSFFIVFRPHIPYSLNKIVNTFFYFFLGLTPVFTYSNDVAYWGAGSFTAEDYILTSFVVLFSLTLYNYMYAQLTQGRQIISSIDMMSYLNFEDTKVAEKRVKFLLLSISLLVALYLLSVNGFDLLNLWFRGKFGDVSRLSERSQVAWLFDSYFIMPILAINIVIYRMLRLNGRRTLSGLVFLLLVAAPPTSMARFAAAAMYTPVVLVLVKRASRPYILSMGLLLSIFFVFPLLDFARMGIDDLADASYLDSISNMFYSGNFDSYQSLMLAMKENIITYGWQLLAVVLFFVPRSIWPDKAIGSGNLISDLTGLSFDNIAANYFAEGFVNFGYFGILLFVLFLAFSSAYFDNIFWNRAGKKASIFVTICYLFSIPLLVFILRGDLLSSTAYTVSYFSAIFLIYKIATVFGSRSHLTELAGD
jgi:hypothetical protein